MSVKVEEKLYQNRYVVDEGRPHIRINEEDAAASGLEHFHFSRTHILS